MQTIQDGICKDRIISLLITCAVFDHLNLDISICVSFTYNTLLQRQSRPTAASDRATTSQRQSFQRLLNRKEKDIAVEKTEIRNWNVKKDQLPTDIYNCICFFCYLPAALANEI
mmetsp:Transcript_10224/g.22733  ORF Transcript_10224/g.22733 Transcript_10224/m.22733 type:complete len:114 (-) Transcript_10224:61-402(-)